MIAHRPPIRIANAPLSLRTTSTRISLGRPISTPCWIRNEADGWGLINPYAAAYAPNGAAALPVAGSSGIASVCGANIRDRAENSPDWFATNIYIGSDCSPGLDSAASAALLETHLASASIVRSGTKVNGNPVETLFIGRS